MTDRTNNPAITLLAGTALAAFRIAIINATTGVADYAGTTDIPIGVTMQTVLIGQPQPLRMLSAGTLEIMAGEAITRGNQVYLGANGKLAASGTRSLGVALDAATADGDIIGVMPSAVAAAIGALVVEALAAATATTALTVSTGGSAGTTLAAATDTDALTDNGGGTADGTVAAQSTFAASVGWNGSSVYPSAADEAALTAIALAIRNNLKEVTTELAKQRTLNIVLINSITSIGTEYNKLRADFADMRAKLVLTGLVT